MKIATLATLAALAAAPAFANDAHHPAAASTTAAAAPATEGEVKKVDREARKLTIKHGEIANLGMPPMTMVFPVTDEKVLETLKAGDKVRFSAEKVKGTITVTQIVAVKE
jgi:Cu(I)/Ag(I) efflux system periplasmic protein CusF